jgi:abortive infection bacteriophage resistance protein
LKYAELKYAKLKYAKPPISSDKQADLLISRGMGGNRDQIIERLNTVGYFRLSAYWYPYRSPNAADPGNPLDTFRTGTDFVEVWNRYVFDRHLRLLVLDAIERIEVAVRSLLVHHHADRHGPFGYALSPASMPGLRWPEWVDHLSSFKRETQRSKDTFVKHFKNKYGDTHSRMPVWMTVELMTFGSGLPERLGQMPGVGKTSTGCAGGRAAVIDGPKPYPPPGVAEKAEPVFDRLSNIFKA